MSERIQINDDDVAYYDRGEGGALRIATSCPRLAILSSQTTLFSNSTPYLDISLGVIHSCVSRVLKQNIVANMASKCFSVLRSGVRADVHRC